jgi:cob(I)alamin adenosyltransferase
MKKFYSSAGDDGYTGVLGEGRVPKHHLRIECVGTIDEATSALGLARSSCKSDKSKKVILEIQKDLYHMMAEVSATPENAEKFRWINQTRVLWLETITDEIGNSIKLPDGFILPGDSLSGAGFALARTIVRRAERRIARLTHQEFLQNKDIQIYLNRLSSLCFVLELFENKAWGVERAALAEK